LVFVVDLISFQLPITQLPISDKGWGRRGEGALVREEVE